MFITSKRCTFWMPLMAASTAILGLFHVDFGIEVTQLQPGISSVGGNQSQPLQAQPNETAATPAAERPQAINATAWKADSISIVDNLWQQIETQDSNSIRLIKFHQQQNNKKPPSGENLCVLSRTFVGQSTALQALLIVLGTNTMQPKKDATIQTISVFVANTHYAPSLSDNKALVDTIQKAVELGLGSDEGPCTFKEV